jgi:WD40 repeat protein
LQQIPTGGKIILLDANSGAEIRTIEVGHEVDILALSDDGQMILAGLNDHEIRIYRKADGSLVKKLDAIAVTGTAWLPGMESLLTVDGNDLLIWDIATGQLTKISLDGYTPLSTIAWSPDSSRLATNTSPVYIWGSFSGRLISQFDVPFGSNAIAWSPDGRQIATDNGTQVFIWATQNGQQLVQLDAMGYHAMNLGWSPNGRFFATLSSGKQFGSERADGVLIIRDARNWAVIRVILVDPLDYLMAWCLP